MPELMNETELSLPYQQLSMRFFLLQLWVSIQAFV